MNQPGVQGCPDCGQLLLSGYFSCLPSVSSFRAILVLDGQFYHPAYWMIKPIDRVVWTTEQI